MPTNHLPAELWPSPPPVSDDPAKVREAGLTSNERVQEYSIKKLISHIEFYPEVQYAVLKLLSENPSKQLIQRMAEAVLSVIADPSPTEAEKVTAIQCVTEALWAGAHPEEKKEEEEVPF